MPHCNGYLTGAVAATSRYDDTEERLNLLLLLSEILAIFLSEKESNAFLNANGISPPLTSAKLHKFSFQKMMRDIYSHSSIDFSVCEAKVNHLN